MIKAWGITDRGAVRHQNQDAYYLDVPDEGLALAVVCDGMGGAKAGNVASTLAVDTFVEALRSGNIDAQGLMRHLPGRQSWPIPRCSNVRAAIRPVRAWAPPWWLCW